MLWLTHYFDASGHPDAKHALAVGGYVSSVPAWLRFEKAWSGVLKPVGIDVFHMADFMACGGDFKHWRGREDEQSALLLKLVGVTKKYVRRSFSTMIRLKAWNEVNQIYALKESHCTPYAICGFFTMDKAMTWLVKRQRRFMARFYFEDGDKHKGDFIWLIDQIVAQDKRRMSGAKPHFEPKTVVPLQAADFVMWEQLNLAKDHIRNPQSAAAVRKSFQQLMTIPRDWGVIDHEKLVRFCDEFDVPKRASGKLRAWTPVQALRQKARAEGRL